MKKSILLFAACALLFTSCCKKQCWQCTVEQNTTPNGPLSDNTHTEMVCDKNAREIRQYEQDNTFVHKTGIVTVTQTTSCK
jgi:hypothetical protein